MVNPQPLISEQQWQELLALSLHKPVVIYKHSRTCPVSAGAWARLSQGLESGIITEPVHVLVVQESRALSNQIAQDLGVAHESPQLLVVKDRRAVYNVSHEAVGPTGLIRVLESLGK